MIQNGNQFDSFFRRIGIGSRKVLYSGVPVILIGAAVAFTAPGLVGIGVLLVLLGILIVAWAQGVL
jgi:hypothetical protein